MNHWPYIIAAYGLTALGTIALSWASWRAMRGAEARADALRRER